MEDKGDVVHSEFDHLNLDERLRPLMDADDELYKVLLGDVITEHAMPLVKTIIGSKLKVYSWQRFAEAVDADDLCNESLANLISYINALRLGQNEHAIRGLDEFVAKVAFNVYNSYLRRKYPQRHRLNRRIQYLLATRGDFDLWKEGDRKVAGFLRWKNVVPAQRQSEVLVSLRQDERSFVVEHLDGQPLDSLPLDRLLSKLFDWIGHPIEVDLLVDVVARLQGIVDQPNDEDTRTSENRGRNESLPSQQADKFSQMEQREYLKRVWNEIVLLPIRQRKALLLNLKLKDGDGLIDALPICRIASPKKIADALEMKIDDLARLWDQLPLSDAQIGEMLGVEPQKVINLRKSARERLARRMEKTSKATG